MNLAETPHLRTGLAVVVGLLCAVTVWSALSFLATPADFRGRQAALAERLSQTERLTKRPAPAGAFGQRPLCAAVAPAELDAIRRTVTAAAGGVRLSYFVVRPGRAPEPTARIAPVSLQLRAEGSYDAMSGFLDRLAAAQPAVFVDRLDLEEASPDVVLKLTGKVFCWTSAQS